MPKIIAEITYDEVVKQALDSDGGLSELLYSIVSGCRSNKYDKEVQKEMTQFSNELSELTNKWRREKHLF